MRSIVPCCGWTWGIQDARPATAYFDEQLAACGVGNAGRCRHNKLYELFDEHTSYDAIDGPDEQVRRPAHAAGLQVSDSLGHIEHVFTRYTVYDTRSNGMLSRNANHLPHTVQNKSSMCWRERDVTSPLSTCSRA